jgi:hypothetical protein
VRVIQSSNYVLQKSSRSKPFVVYANKLKKCFGPAPNNWLPTEVTSKVDYSLPSMMVTLDSSLGGDNLVQQGVLYLQSQRWRNQTNTDNDRSCDVGDAVVHDEIEDRRVLKPSRKAQHRLQDFVCSHVVFGGSR